MLSYCANFFSIFFFAFRSGNFFSGFIPLLDQQSIYNAISLLGAVVMPHNLFLHSALVLVSLLFPVTFSPTLTYTKLPFFCFASFLFLFSQIIYLFVSLVPVSKH